MKHYDKYVQYRFSQESTPIHKKKTTGPVALAHRSFTVVAPAAPVATTAAVPNVSLSSSASLDLSAAASGKAGIAKKFATEVAKEYAWDQAKASGKEVLASIVSSDSMADASGFLLGM